MAHVAIVSEKIQVVIARIVFARMVLDTLAQGIWSGVKKVSGNERMLLRFLSIGLAMYTLGVATAVSARPLGDADANAAGADDDYSVCIEDSVGTDVGTMPPSNLSPSLSPSPSLNPSLNPASPGVSGGTGDTTYIVSLRQSDTSCPSARSCPGEKQLEVVCNMETVDFDCSTSWSTGMVVMFPRSQTSLSEAIREQTAISCQSKCAASLSVLTIEDAPLLSGGP
jgi:hypothetical protein